MANGQGEAARVRMGGLYAQTDRDGNFCLRGKIGGQYGPHVEVYVNSRKQKQTDPDYIMYVCRYPQNQQGGRQGGHSGSQQQGGYQQPQQPQQPPPVQQPQQPPPVQQPAAAPPHGGGQRFEGTIGEDDLF